MLATMLLSTAIVLGKELEASGEAGVLVNTNTRGGSSCPIILESADFKLP